ncbi:flagellar basal body rod modification protein [Vagococcus sp. DIV0080]|uniref:Flagellar basal body rod modification protein n=1 Tax=Candidatus Vagococcus giribetii TaxID=2230876 RepID=A0ABS3HT82_9ENTE|nr:flagellar hook capping FlgD N-terminal domain-containing protein [Vagococcus sp. DIV0080]MBO0476968.1 flagellar basal body rod modification protein [Vagococcus sp. DIV0080]
MPEVFGTTRGANDYTGGYEPQSKKSNNGLDMDGFLKILAASMANPSFDGSDGGNGTDYITQMVTFATLEQLQEMGEDLEYTMMMAHQQQAIGLIGKTVTVVVGKDETVEGVVEQVKFVGGLATLVIDGEDYLMSQVSVIGEGSKKESEGEGETDPEDKPEAPEEH